MQKIYFSNRCNIIQYTYYKLATNENENHAGSLHVMKCI